MRGDHPEIPARLGNSGDWGGGWRNLTSIAQKNTTPAPEEEGSLSEEENGRMSQQLNRTYGLEGFSLRTLGFSQERLRGGFIEKGREVIPEGIASTSEEGRSRGSDASAVERKYYLSHGGRDGTATIGRRKEGGGNGGRNGVSEPRRRP